MDVIAYSGMYLMTNVSFRQAGTYRSLDHQTLFIHRQKLEPCQLR